MVRQMKHVFALCRILAAAVVIGGAGLALAEGEIYVLESSAPSIKVGKVYAPADTIAIPDGASIRVVLPSGKTQLIRGPFKGRAGDLAKGQRPNAGVIAWLRSLLATGGATENTPGATRSARPVEVAGSFSWTAVPVSVDSTFCIEKEAKLQLDRGAWFNAARVAVVDTAGALQGESKWTAGAKTAPWPSGVALRPDATYVLLVAERPQRKVTLRVLDRLPGEDDVLAVLEARGCRYQFEALVKEKIGAGRS
jgi:hypothetical protein